MAAGIKRDRVLLFYGFAAITFMLGLLLSLLGSHLMVLWKDTWAIFFARMIEHGGEIIGVVALLSLVSERLAQFTILAIFSEDMSERIRRLVFQDFPGIAAAGLIGIRDQMDFGGLFRSLETKDELFWLDTYAPSVQLWIQDVEDAARRGVILNFMILWPKSDLAPMRAVEIGRFYSPENFSNELQTFANLLQEVRANLAVQGHGNINLRYYKDLLGCPVYLIRRDGKPYRAYSSLYLGRATGTKFPHFEWSSPKSLSASESPLLAAFDDYVRAKWDRSAPIAPSPQVTATAPAAKIDLPGVETKR